MVCHARVEMMDKSVRDGVQYREMATAWQVEAVDNCMAARLESASSQSLVEDDEEDELASDTIKEVRQTVICVGIVKTMDDEGMAIVAKCWCAQHWLVTGSMDMVKRPMGGGGVGKMAAMGSIP